MSAPGLIDRFRRSLEARLVASSLLLSVIALGVVATIAYSSARASLTDELLRHLSATAELHTRELNRWVDAQIDLLEVIAALPVPSGFGAREAERLVRASQARDRDLSEVFILSARGGRVIASTDPGRLDSFHTSDPFYLEGRYRTFVQNVYASPSTGLPTLTVSTPLVDDSGGLRGVLAANLDLERMDRIVAQQTGAGPSSEAYLVTGSSDFLSSSRFGRPEYRRGVHTEGVAAVVRHRSGVGLYTNYAGVPVIGAYRWIKERELALLVEVGQRQAFAPARRLLTRIIAFGAATMLLLLLGVRWIGRRVARPISAVSRAAERLAAGDFSARAPRGGPDEVGTLARSFNSMTGQLRSLYEDLEGQIQLSTEALQALEQSKSLLKSIVDNSTTLIAVIDADDRLMLANHAFEDLFGVGEEAAIGSQLDEVVPETVAKASDEAIAAVRDRGAVVDREISWGEGSGLRAFLSVWFPLPDPERGGTGIGVIATEVTARKRAEEEQLRLESQLRHAQKLESLGVLAGGIAHDFNNILAAILGFADLARGSGSPDVDESLEHIVTAAQRAAELTTQMLAYAGRATFRMEKVDLNESITKLSELVSVSLPKTVTLITQLDPEPVIVEADPSQVSQIVMNLLTNAGQAVGSASGVVEIRTRRASRGVGPGRVVLTVSDSGEGMPPEVLDRIFDPFFTTKEAGTGLGLAAVLGIVKGMDGTIEVSSEPDAGTTFTVTFPLCEDPPMQIDTARATRSPAAAGSTVLVVDDEPAVRGFTRKVLERYGFQVLEAADGIAGALAYELDRDRIQAVVLDMSMPGMSGAEVFDTMRRLRPNVPVVFTSGYDPADAMAALASDGAVRFIQKPYRPAALVEALGDLLNGEDAAQEICS